MKAGSTTSVLRVDPVCFFVAEADKAGAEDGVTEIYNSYIRNTSTAVLTLPVCAGAKFALITRPAPSSATVSASTFVQQMPAGVTSASYPQDTPIAAVVIAAGKTCAGMGIETYIP